MSDEPRHTGRTGLLLDPFFERHDPGPGHPEQVARYTAIRRRLAACGLDRQLPPVPVRAAGIEEIALAHDRKYIQLAAREIEAGRRDLSTGDTALCEATFAVACHAAGSMLNAVDLVMEKSIDRAFCALRPPGHHATPDRGMGFCLFNNIAIAARHAQATHGIERVAIIDWDVHHGNGTQDIFYDDPSVFFFSTHQWPLYPGTGARRETGAGAGRGTTLNCPFPAGSGMAEIGGAFTAQLQPAMDRFKPQLILLSAGFDSRIGDPLGGFTLDDDDFRELTAQVAAIADRHAHGRLISCLEGGYDVDGLASAVEAHLRALASL